ncbi:hypothetical protein QFZ31_006644 [Neobacillus niacini]|uniref:hypothetical protein n=1 Tax=Neobacillus driksii TaxID=3035913 RepID=UPI002788C54E|nr:hypothetical protein [Neobacillus niacini]MDQ0976592.1 hypothetical protein [Neobacillus niacini]
MKNPVTPDIYKLNNYEIVGGDILIFIGGILVGSILLFFYNVKMFSDIYITPVSKSGNKDLNYVKVTNTHSGKTFTYFNPRTFLQTAELLSTYLWWKYSKKGKSQCYSIHSGTKAFTIFVTFLAVSAVIVIWALYCIATIQYGHHHAT